MADRYSGQTNGSDRGEKQRMEVVAATWRVISRDGLESATMRNIAKELDCTTGFLTHYFRDKESLLEFVYQVIGDSLTDRMTEGFVDQQVNRASLITMLGKLLPDQTEQHMGWRVWLNYSAAALTRPPILDNYRGRYENLRIATADMVRHLQAEGEVEVDRDPENTADELICAADGIGFRATLSPDLFPPERQHKMLHHMAQSIMGPVPGRPDQ